MSKTFLEVLGNAPEKVAKTFSEIAKNNPYHGPDGRFTTAGAASTISGGVATTTNKPEGIKELTFSHNRKRCHAMVIPKEVLMGDEKWIGEMDNHDIYQIPNNGWFDQRGFVAVKKSKIAKNFNEIAKFNPYHGADGRFTSAGGGVASFSANPNTKAGKLAIEREEKKNPLVGSAFGTGKTVREEAKENADIVRSKLSNEVKPIK